MGKRNKSKDEISNVKELSKKELVNDIVDQETGEVKKGQPGATNGEGVSDRPTMTEQEARDVNGYGGFKNVAEQREADPTRSQEKDGDTLVKKG